MRALALKIRKPKLPVLQKKEYARQQELFDLDPRPETICFRSQTLAIMRHFFEISSQLGRLPSLLGREFFRAKVSHHAIPSFEDQAVFARDIELCLARLDDEHAEMISLIGLYDFSREEIAAMLHCTRGWVNQHASKAVDSLTEIFLWAGVLKENRPDRRQCQVTNRSIPADVVAAGKKKPAPCVEVELPEQAGGVLCVTVGAEMVRPQCSLTAI